MSSYRILDLDNCISNDAWRIPLIDWKMPPGNPRYQKYHDACGLDVFENRHLVDTRHEIIVMTGRPCSVREQTMSWLKQHGIRVKHLLMRNNGDERKSVEVKRTQLGWLQGDYGVSLREVVGAYDDHPEIVAMYREQGLPAWQEFIHKVSAYVNPITKEQVL